MAMTMVDRMCVFALERSWRLYSHAFMRVGVQTRTGRVQIPIMRAIGLNNLRFTAQEERFVGLLDFLIHERPGTVIDVGANIGRFLLYVMEVDRRTPYVGCEPNLDCSSYVETLIRANGLQDHAILPIGLSDAPAIRELLLNDEFDVCATAVANFYTTDKFRNRKQICMDTGDHVLANLGVAPISLIKIDVEGGELEALRGLIRTLRTHRPFLIVEIAPYAHLLDARTSAAAEQNRRDVAAFRKRRIKELEAFLRDELYRPFKIEDGSRLLALDSLDPGSSIDLSEMDYLCVPEEASGEIIGRLLAYKSA